MRSIVENVQSASGKANSVLDRADKLIADNSGALHSTLSNIDAVLQDLERQHGERRRRAEGVCRSRQEIDPLAQRLQSLSDDADKLVKAIDAEKVRSVVDNADTFSHALAASSDNYQALMRDGASLRRAAQRHVDTAQRGACRRGNVLKAIDPHKVTGIVDSISDVATTVRENRGNIDATIKNATELTAKLNDSADKIDGLITSAQSFFGAPGTKGAMTQVGDAAQSVKKLADDVDVRVKEISVGLNRFSNSGLRQYEALAIQGQRVLDDIDRAVRSFERNPGQAHLRREAFAAGISRRSVMGRAGGPVRSRLAAGAAALALALAACASAPSTVYDLSAAEAAGGAPVAGADSASPSRWRPSISTASAFWCATASLLRCCPADGGRSSCRRCFALGSSRRSRTPGSPVRWMAAPRRPTTSSTSTSAPSNWTPRRPRPTSTSPAKIVALNSGRVADVEIFTANAPVASTDAATVVAALDQAAATVMTKIVAFVARRL